MKVLQINCVYKKGSTGKIVYDLHTEFKKQNIDSVVCYGRGQKSSEGDVYKTCSELYSKFNNLRSRLTGIMYGGCYFSTFRLIKRIKQENPDIVHLQCINGYFVNIYKLVKWLKENDIPTVATLHADFMFTGGCGSSIDCHQWKNRTGCGYSGCPRWRSETGSILFDRTNTMWKKMKYSFEGFENLTVVSVSPWLAERAKQSIIFADKENIPILNGIDTTIFHSYDTVELKTQLKLNGKKVIFHATACFSPQKKHLKGGYYVLELAKRLENENVIILVAGRSEPIECIPNNIIFLGNVTDQKQLAQYYSMADVTLLTSERETFSMVTAESLCCGTPLVGFFAGGPESIALKEYSTFVKHGDIDALQDAVLQWLEKSKPCDIEDAAHSKYSKQRMVQDYIKCYNKLLSK